jgi:hypothetical protein
MIIHDLLDMEETVAYHRLTSLDWCRLTTINIPFYASATLVWDEPKHLEAAIHGLRLTWEPPVVTVRGVIGRIEGR